MDCNHYFSGSIFPNSICMNSYADKNKENKSTSAIRSQQSQLISTPALQFADSRPEAIAQMKLQETLNTSPPVKQLKAFQDAVNNAQQTKQLKFKNTNGTGLPDNLKSGIENLSGHIMDDVKVHYNSNKPAQLQAHAQGTDIHIASGQERHLTHEAWHVVQQKQGRVKPTLQLKGKIDVNDDAGLEKEADLMGARLCSIR